MAQKKKHRSGNPGKQAHHHPKKPVARQKKIGWIAGARPHTLPVAIAPVIVGAGVAVRAHVFDLTLLLLALAVALFLQIGVNYANDYSDGVRGTDDHRVGPGRLTATGAKRAEHVRIAAFVFFGLALLAGIAITVLTQIWWLIAVGLVAVAAAWFYTGGKRPYGYSGLGEVAVFIFFGPVATMGTAFIQMKAFSFWALAGGVAMGLLAAAVLLINNIRDIDTDRIARKKTLATRLGQRASIGLYVVMLALPMLGALAIGFLLTDVLYVQFGWLIIAPAILIAVTARTAGEFITLLKLTTWSTLVYAVLFGLMIAQPWVAAA